ncbi:MAG: murein biosynthesis integral membrane protein MurJ [Verrucomicrobiales bacterium]|nr:murein biosynthesis integral membrane protein MurJ [Verrucomicrobiales bacterium]
MSQMLKSSAAMAGATLVSRVLGLVREMVYARFMGNGWVASAFMLAFQIPNLFRRLLGEGALTAAFIPHFKEKEKTEGEEAMWESANAVVSGLVAVCAVLVGAVIVGVTMALRLGEFREQTELMLRLLRWMIPYTLLVCVAAVCVGMLNARGRFFVPALGASVLNVVMIASVLWWAPRLGDQLPQQVYGLAYGVIAAGVAQAAFQLPSLMRCGWCYRWVAPWRNASVRVVLWRMIPTTLGAAAFQLNVVITQGFGFMVGDTVVASFQYAVRLLELPQGLFGVSMASFLLPTLAGMAAEKRHAEFRSTLVRGLSHVMVVNALASVLLGVLAVPMVRLLFEGGLFQAAATERVASALRFLAPALLAYSGTAILTRAFYAVGDTKVPMQISVFCLAANTILSILLALSLKESGLALANTLTSVGNLALLGFALRKKFSKLDPAGFVEGARWVVLASLVAGLVAWGVGAGWGWWVGGEGFWRKLGAVFVPAGVAAAAYFMILIRGRMAAAVEMLEWVWRRVGRGGGAN